MGLDRFADSRRFTQAAGFTSCPMVWRNCELKRYLMLRQNWIAWSLNISLRPCLRSGCPCQLIVESSQMSRELRSLSASLYVFQFTVRYF